MSNEPVNSEVDCAVAPYSHHHLHHHHHHLPPHQNLHLQHHHNPHLEQSRLCNSSQPVPTGSAVSVEVGDEFDNQIGLVDEPDENATGLIDNCEQKVQFECDEGHVDGLTKLVTRINCDHSQRSTINECAPGQLTQLENVVNQTEVQNCTPHLGNHNTESVSPQSSSTSGNSDISESEDEDEADEDSGEDDDEDEDSNDEDDDDEDEDDYDDEETDDDDIVDPVGQQPNSHPQRLGMADTNGYDCNGTNMNCYDRINNNHESSTVDEEVSFEDDVDESTPLHDTSTTGILDSERMLEVTRKLVRSTERDPDRDLRKQVLLRTAIRKLPHFMEYNHYSESFDQSFQMHNNTLDSSNSSVTCMSSAQYYEHNHLNSQMDSQPKAYYHSVQPNAIQMSTTSLRMLDLNDDTKSEHAINSLGPVSLHDHAYESHPDTRGSLEQQHQQSQQDYASHQIYNQHYAPIDTQTVTLMHEHNSSGSIHDYSQYDSSHEPNGGMIVRHSTLENLYQPIDGNNVSEDMKVADQAAIKSDHEFDRLAPGSTTVVPNESLPNKSDINDNMIEAPQQSVVNVSSLEEGDTSASIHRDIIDHPYQRDHDCNQSQTDTTAFYDSNETRQNSMHLTMLEPSESKTQHMPSNETDLTETLEASDEDQSGCSEGGSSNSSQSSTASDDSVNSTSSQSNDSGGGLSGISILETSLNTSEDHRYNRSHDSGVALFSPKSNKRSSSSIGLDDEMEIDHLTDLTSSNQFNSSGSISTLNQCKRMRKREIID